MRLRKLTVAIGLIGLAASSGALASGYHFGTQSARAQGTSNANGAEAADASTVFANPAGLAYLPGTQVSGVLSIVAPKVSYTDTGSYTAVGNAAVVNGKTDGGDFASTTAVPHVYASHQLNDQLVLGFGVFVPFGSKTSYDADWAGRYNIIDTQLKTLAFNPSMSFKLNPKVKLGLGLTAQRMDGQLIKGTDYAAGVASSFANKAQALGAQAAAAAQAGQGATAAALGAAATEFGKAAQAAKALSGNPDYSGDVKVNGDGWGYGFNLGAMFDLTDSTRVGIAYRSRINHTLKGTADWNTDNAGKYTTAAGLTSPVPGAGGATFGQLAANGLMTQYADSDAELKVETPDSLSLSIFSQVTPKLALMADVTRTGHSKFQELRVDFLDGAANKPDSITAENWSDTTKVAVGAQYQLNDKVELRGGIAYDQSPVGVDNRTPSIPDHDRRWVSLGATVALDKNSSVDLAYSYVFLPKAKIDNADWCGMSKPDGSQCTSSFATIKGEYDVKSHIVGVQYNHKF